MSTPKTKRKDRKITRDTLICGSELHRQTGIGRFTIQGAKRAGYVFKAAGRTTVAHFEEWMAAHPDFRASYHFDSTKNRVAGATRVRKPAGSSHSKTVAAPQTAPAGTPDAQLLTHGQLET